MAVQYTNEEMMALLARRFRKLHDHTHAASDVVSMMLSMPAIVAGWTGILDRNTPALMDITGNGLNLSFNNSPTIAATGLLTYLNLGATGYFSHADTALLDITGAETTVSSPGLAMMCWAYTDALGGATRTIMSKWLAAGNQRSYQYNFNASGGVTFQVSSNGTATTTVSSANSLVSDDTWYFTAARYTPSTELKVWLDLDSATNTTSIPATLFNSTALFNVGALSAALPLNGRVAYPLICASALSDEAIETFAAMTSPLVNRRL